MSVDLTIRSIGSTPAAAGTELASRAGRVEKTPDPAEKFESFVLQTFIQELLPKNTESVFGQGIAGDYWKSMMSEKIAEQVAARGNIGIADFVRKGHASDLPASAAALLPSSDPASSLSALSQALSVPLTSASDGD